MTVPRILLVRCDLERHRLPSVRRLHGPVTRGVVDERSRFFAGVVGNKLVAQPRDGFRSGSALPAHRDISCSRTGYAATPARSISRQKADAVFTASRCGL